MFLQKKAIFPFSFLLKSILTFSIVLLLLSACSRGIENEVSIPRAEPVEESKEDSIVEDLGEIIIEEDYVEEENLVTSTTDSEINLETEIEAEVKGQKIENQALLYFFWGEGCPYCETQKIFLEKMEKKYPNLEIKMYETWKNKENAQILQNLAQAYNTNVRGVPMTFIGEFSPLVGFSSSMENDLENKIKTCLAENCIDPFSKL